MIQVERHNIKGNDEIERLCNNAKLLFNRVNFLMRQSFFSGQKLPSMTELTNAMRPVLCFTELHNTKTAKQTIRKCLTDWSNFFKSLKAWGHDKSKFLGKPKPPGYKDKMAQVIFYGETVLGGQSGKKPNSITPTNFLFTLQSDHCHDYKQVVVTPKAFGFVVEVSFEVKVPRKSESKAAKEARAHHCFVDLGVNNLAAITSDQPGVQPILINGRIVKSINRGFNKNRTKHQSQKRYWRLENYFHHASKFLVGWCLANGIGNIVIGRNTGWKQRGKMRKKNSQNFQSIPFFRLIKKVEYKAEMANISVTFTEEAWTSQASFFDGDPIPCYEKGTEPPKVSGNRLKRGLFVTADGRLLNADINASLNIGRKVIGNGLISEVDRSLAERPVAINPLRPTKVGPKGSYAKAVIKESPGLTNAQT